MNKPSRRERLLPLLLLFATVGEGVAQERYVDPPEAIRQVLDAPLPPTPFVSPTGEKLALAHRLTYPPISDLAEPMLRLAGVRINPQNNGEHGARYWIGLTLRAIPDGPDVPVSLPPGSRIGSPVWNPSGTRIAFSNTTERAIELWVVDAGTAKARRIEGVRLNPVLRDAFSWMPDGQSLVAKLVPDGRGAEPTAPAVPPGPRIEQGTRVASASSTYESRDLLRTPHDADLFQYYATSQLAIVETAAGREGVTRVGPPVVHGTVEPSPSGEALLVERVERPYSFLRSYVRFPLEVEIRDRTGKPLEKVASLPLAEQVPVHGERTGPREYGWTPTEPATLCWAEALDDGDTYKEVPHHDKVVCKSVGGPARELIRLEQRFAGLQWTDVPGLALISDHDEDKHWYRTLLVDAHAPKAAPRLVWSLSTDDRYGDPGNPVYHQLPNGHWTVRVHAGSIYLQGSGATPEGDRPFLDRLELETLRTTRLFRSDHARLERFMTWLDPGQGTFLTLRQSPSDPPNVFVRTLGNAVAGDVATGEPVLASTARAVTTFPDPTPQLRKIEKKLVTYERADGLSLSFTLYLPPGHEPGQRLPTVLWAYPLDYTDPAMAGQVDATPQEFTTIRGASPLFFTLAGYAVLDSTAMPVVGPSETVYDTFIEQITANAEAAIGKAVELGVTDPDRVAVMGHSHGALMTANLLAWTDLFRAGVARSGAYNHTLRPFGFQNERRPLYEAPDTYFKLSPLIHADKIDEPLLIIHGELDANPGTVTLQSEKLFEALRGVGGTTRLVILPHESHGYAARESVGHTIQEMLAWLDRHVKDAPARRPAGK